MSINIHNNTTSKTESSYPIDIGSTIHKYNLKIQSKDNLKYIMHTKYRYKNKICLYKDDVNEHKNNVERTTPSTSVEIYPPAARILSTSNIIHHSTASSITKWLHLAFLLVKHHVKYHSSNYPICIEKWIYLWKIFE